MDVLENSLEYTLNYKYKSQIKKKYLATSRMIFSNGRDGNETTVLEFDEEDFNQDYGEEFENMLANESYFYSLENGPNDQAAETQFAPIDFYEEDSEGGESDASDEEEFAAAVFPGKKNKKVKGRPRKTDSGSGLFGSTKLSPEVAKIMGAANRAYVEKKYDESIKLIMDVIRHEPNSHETYRLLALIYDELGQKDKSFGYYAIAAHLTPKDANLWKTLAVMSKDMDQPDQNLYYLSKAFKANPQDPHFTWEYVNALKSAGNKRKAADILKELLNEDPTDLQILREMAQLYVESGHVKSAASVFRRVLTDEDNHKSISFTHLNIYIDLLHIQEDFETAVDAVFDIGFTICKENNPSFNFLDEIAVIREFFPLQIIGKLVIAMGRCGKMDEAKENDLDYSNPIYEKIANTFYNEREFELARSLFLKISQDEKTTLKRENLMRIAKCSRELGHLKDAIRYYEQVANDDEANMAIAEIYEDLGLSEKANEYIQKIGVKSKRSKLLRRLRGEDDDDSSESEVEESVFYDQQAIKDIQLLYQKALFLGSSPTRFQDGVLSEEYIVTLRSLYDDFRHNGFLFREPREKLKPFRVSDKGFKIQTKKLKTSNNDEMAIKDLDPRESALHGLTIDEWFDVIVRIIVESAIKSEFKEAFAYGGKARKSNIFHFDEVLLGRLDLLLLVVSDLAKDGDAAGYYCRNLIALSDPERITNFVNLYSATLSRLSPSSDYTSSKHFRFFCRQMHKVPDNAALQVLVGNIFLSTKNHYSALSRYLKAESLKGSFLTKLALAIVYLHISMKRNTKNRNHLLSIAFSYFFKLMEMRDFDQESLYNVARAFHHIGLLQYALHFYGKALKRTGDLERTIRYNMHLIFLKSGNTRTARMILSTKK